MMKIKDGSRRPYHRGKNHSNWKGGRTINHGYVLIDINMLSNEDKDLVEPMTWVQKNGRKQLYEHRYVMAKHLSRVLTRDEIVHHKNGIKTDNRLENLEILNQLQHPRGHKLEVPYLKICF